MSLVAANRAEVPVAVSLTALGIAMTSWAALSHTAPLVAPGAALVFFGGAWTGNALARHDVRLFPSGRASDQHAEEKD
jgi:hypothetical protein